MRHCIYLTVLFSVISNVMLAQNHDYVILRMTTEANVRYKGADEWQPLKEKDVVNLFDVIDLVGDGTVSIMKTATRAVYSTSDTEPATVYDVIRKAEDKHMGVVRNVFKEAVSDNSAKKSDFSSYGASVRGQESGSNTDAVYAAVCAAVNSYFTYGSVQVADTDISLTRVYDGDFYSFRVTNETPVMQFVNVVCINTSVPSFDLCYTFDVTPVAVPGEETLLPGEFCGNMDGTIYLLVASPENFDSGLVDMSLKKRLAPKSDALETVTVNIEIQ